MKVQPRTDPLGTVIAYIHPGQTSAYFTHSLVGLVTYDRVNGQHVVNVIQEWSSANVSAARNNVVRTFLDGPYADWLLFIDSDMAFAPEALDAILENADPVKAPIIGGLCFGDDGQLFPTMWDLHDSDAGWITVRRSDYPDNAMVAVAATGAAFLLIHRDVLKKFEAHGFDKAFPWFQETQVAGQPCGEDITFCLRALQLGIQVWVNTGIHVGHHKSRLLTHEMFQAQRSEQ